MSERLADVTARIENIGQLDAVVTAMRGISAARAQQGRRLLEGIEAYAGTVSAAISQAVGSIAEEPRPGGPVGHGRAVILFLAEQGFVGAFSDHVLDAAQNALAGAHLLILGTRGGAIAADRGIAANWGAAMVSHIESVTGLANRIADVLYSRIVQGRVASVEVFYARHDADRAVTVEHMVLFPLDIATFRSEQQALPPLFDLDPRQLLEKLAAEYIYARLCEAAMHSFAAENQARMEAMSEAATNIGHTLEDLRQRQNQVRQEEVTAEIVELSAAVLLADAHRQ